MTLTELINEVYTLTARPDRVAETLSAVRAATLKVHQADFFYKDIFETGLAFDSSDFVQQLDYRTLVPRWRANKYLRKWDYVNSTPMGFLDHIVPENVLDRYKTQRQDIYYVAGAYININSSTAQQYYLWGCYLNPDIGVNTYSSWIALDHPYAIVYEAAATVLKAIGKNEDEASFRNMAADQLQEVKISNIQPLGY